MYLCRARESLEERWDDTQTAPFANLCIKHAVITMAVVPVHFGLRTLRSLALRIGASNHGHRNHALATYTNSFRLTNSLFGEGLGKTVAQAATTSRHYKAMGDCFILSCLS